VKGVKGEIPTFSNEKRPDIQDKTPGHFNQKMSIFFKKTAVF